MSFSAALSDVGVCDGVCRSPFFKAVIEEVELGLVCGSLVLSSKPRS